MHIVVVKLLPFFTPSLLAKLLLFELVTNFLGKIVILAFLQLTFHIHCFRPSYVAIGSDSFLVTKTLNTIQGC